jgi:hypothetical protein
MRDRTRQKFGELGKIGEKAWMARYLQMRRDWLANSSNALLHKTVYRMDALKALVDAGNWDLDLAVLVRGCQITPQAFGDPGPVKVAAEGEPRRLLWLTEPPMKGADVDWLQQRLPRAGYDVPASAVFDADTDAALRRFQAAEGLHVDGIVGPVTRSALEDLSVTVPLKATADIPMPAVPMPAAPEVLVDGAPDQTVVSHVKTTPQSGGIHPAHPVPSPTHPAHPASPHSDNGDPINIDDLKRHISQEVQNGLQGVRDEMSRLAQLLSVALKGGDASAVLGSLRVKAISDMPGRLRKVVSNGRTLLATFTSLAVLVVTESRDALVWGEHAPAQTHPAPPAILHSLPQAGDIAGTAVRAFQSLHGLAAQLPPDWTFRLRIGALVLIAYATWRLIVRRFQAKKIVETVADPE